ncbi:MAG: DUF192 domain-containing protein [Deltaproteobacteria bacterium]|nr:DUF192 domain-containing protein [Deltaproteobacteria bacterium]
METGRVLVHNLKRATTVWTRFKGLMGRNGLEQDTGLYLRPCRQIHMFFMRFPIDAVFVDRNWVVVGLEPNLKPWRLSTYYLTAEAVLELPVGTIARSGLEPGHRLVGEPNP